jgi:hypothetical protein
MMDRRAFVIGGGAILTAPLAAKPQEAKIVRLGALLFGATRHGCPPHDPSWLSALGYVEGRNILFEHRHGEGRPVRGRRRVDRVAQRQSPRAMRRALE